MALFKRKEEVPKIEPYTSNPFSSQIPSLPSLPKNTREEINQNLIKSSLEEKKQEVQPDDHSRFKPNEEIPSIQNVKTSESALLPNIPLPIQQPPFQQVKSIVSSESVFVKIDKFREAKKEILEIRKNLNEAAELIKKIKELEKEEEEELKDIDLNLDSLKKRFNEIESLLFDQV